MSTTTDLGPAGPQPAGQSLPAATGAPAGPPSTLADRTARYATRAEWLASRAGFLGASEIAAALGLSVYKDNSPFRVWSSKVGAPVPEDPQKQRDLDRGNRAQAAILGEFADEHPEWIVEPWDNAVVAHPVYGDRIRTSLDATVHARDDDCSLIAVADAKFVERKSNHWGEPGTDEMPADYVIQGLVQCECAEVPVCWFPVWFGRWDFSVYRVERNPEVAETLLVRAMEWWDRYVVTKEYPPLDGSAASESFLRHLHPRDALPMLPATEEAVALAKTLRAAKDAVKAAKDDETAAKVALLELIGSHAGIDGVATYRANKDTRVVDWEAVARSLGADQALIDEHTTTKPGARVLRLKGA